MQAELAEAQTEAGEFRRQIDYFSRTVRRQRSLLKRGVTTRSRADAAELDVAVARERLSTATAKAARLRAVLANNPDLPLEKRAIYREKHAVLAARRLDLDRTVVRAPIAGVVTNMRLQVGEHLEAGDAAFSLIVDQTPWVMANLKETELTHIEVGQRATVSPDAYPDIQINAVVQSISPATGAEFAILPPQNATGNWVKVVQRLPVKLKLESGPKLEYLRAGMSVKAKIDTERKRESLLALQRNWFAIAGEPPPESVEVTPRRRR
jgi:membrane fusion protein (multidrug efflux system)